MSPCLCNGFRFIGGNGKDLSEPVAITNMRLHVLSEGYGYDLVSRRPQVPGLLLG